MTYGKQKLNKSGGNEASRTTALRIYLKLAASTAAEVPNENFSGMGTALAAIP